MRTPVPDNDQVEAITRSPPPEVQSKVEGNEMQIEDNSETAQTKSRRRRHRKSKLYETIQKQMEFYFSDANLTKQRVMKEIVQSSEYVPLTIFLEKFNKISQICKNIDDLRRALKHSETLELSEDSSGVKRKVPFDESKVKDEQAVERCTIYVENIPSNVNHEWVEKIFQEFGQVAYVSLPKFKRSKQPKGFAFVEFAEEESAKRCLEAYGEIGGCLSSTIDPSALQSISSFSEEAESTKKEKKGRKRKKQISDASSLKEEEDNEDGVSKKKAKTSEEKTEKDAKQKSKATKDERTSKKGELEHDDLGSEKSEQDSPASESEVEGTKNEDEPMSNKPKKKRRKKKNKGIPDSEEKLESDLIHLKILPKKNWRQLRNRYLNLQRENFGKLKAQLRSAPTFKPQQTSTGQYKSVCIKIQLSTPSSSREELAEKVTSEIAPADWSNFVKFVDYEADGSEAVIRLDGGPRAGPGITTFLTNAKSAFKDARIMTEKETDDYWLCSRAKLKEKQKAKTRGKDRLLNQAAKFAASHIHFEDADKPDPAAASQE